MEVSPVLILVAVLLLYVISAIKILAEYQRGVIFRLGKLLPQPKGPGVILVFAPIDRMIRVSLRTVAFEVPPQDVITRDNVSVKVSAVLYYRVIDPRRAIVEVENYQYATLQLAQTTLRSVLGQATLDDLLAERDRLNQQLQAILDQHAEPWGIKVSAVEVKHVDLPADMQRSMARQAEAERDIPGIGAQRGDVVVDGPRYHTLFPRMQLSKNTETEFHTTMPEYAAPNSAFSPKVVAPLAVPT